MSSGRQLDLFGGAPGPAGPRRPAAPVAPAAVPPELLDLASRLPPGLRLGTSSWAFPGWAGLVYAEGASETELSRDGLAAYARHPLLGAVGLDRTFYAPLGVADLARHAAQVPAGFRFLVKALQGCTFPTVRTAGSGVRSGWRPNPRWLDPAFATEAVVRPALEGLGDRLGALLFQFPPLPRHEVRDPPALAARVGAFLSALPRGPLYAVEIRNRELLVPAWGAALEEAGAAHAYVVHPSMPPVLDQAGVLPLERQPSLVVRWMLGHGRGYEEAKDLYAPFDALAAPDPASRGQIARLCLRAAALGRESTVIVNNKAEGSSPVSVLELARELAAAAAGPQSPR